MLICRDAEEVMTSGHHSSKGSCT